MKMAILDDEIMDEILTPSLLFSFNVNGVLIIKLHTIS